MGDIVPLPKKGFDSVASKLLQLIEDNEVENAIILWEAKGEVQFDWFGKSDKILGHLTRTLHRINQWVDDNT